MLFDLRLFMLWFILIGVIFILCCNILISKPLNQRDENDLCERDELCEYQPGLDPLYVRCLGQLFDDTDEQRGDGEHDGDIDHDGRVEEVWQFEERCGVADNDEEKWW